MVFLNFMTVGNLLSVAWGLIIFHNSLQQALSSSVPLRGKQDTPPLLLQPQKLASHSGLEYDNVENSDSVEDNYGTFIFRILLFYQIMEWHMAHYNKFIQKPRKNSSVKKLISSFYLEIFLLFKMLYSKENNSPKNSKRMRTVVEGMRLKGKQYGSLCSLEITLLLCDAYCYYY